jgi:hypothetical protein
MSRIQIVRTKRAFNFMLDVEIKEPDKADDFQKDLVQLCLKYKIFEEEESKS